MGFGGPCAGLDEFVEGGHGGDTYTDVLFEAVEANQWFGEERWKRCKE